MKSFIVDHLTLRGYIPYQWKQHYTHMLIIGKKIRELRHSKEWSQEHMAGRLGISIAAYSKIESGITDMNLSRLEQIAGVFGRAATELLRAGEEEEKTTMSKIVEVVKLIGEREQDIITLQNKIIELYQELERSRSLDRSSYGR